MIGLDERVFKKIRDKRSKQMDQLHQDGCINRMRLQQDATTSGDFHENFPDASSEESSGARRGLFTSNTHNDRYFKLTSDSR